MECEARVFSGRSNPELADEIIKILGYTPGKISVKNFSDGEIRLRFEENIRGTDIFIVQSTNPPAENILELLLIIDAARRASARRITAVIPYYGYCRQDRKDQPRVPISARLVMDIIVSAGADRIVAMDLHSAQIQGFVNIPFDNLYAKSAFLDKIKAIFKDKDFTIVAPDIGGIKLARSYAKILDVPLSIIDKRRSRPNEAEIMNVAGNIKMKNALIIDDMIDTGGTVFQAAKLIKSNGADMIIAVAAHGLFSDPAVSRITSSPIDKVIVSNSIHIPPEKKFPKLEIVSVAPILAETIKRTHNEESVSSLFDF